MLKFKGSFYSILIVQYIQQIFTRTWEGREENYRTVGAGPGSQEEISGGSCLAGFDHRPRGQVVLQFTAKMIANTLGKGKKQKSTTPLPQRKFG